MAKLVDILEKFPFPPEEKKPALIRKSEYSTALYPPNDASTSDNTFTIISTDTFMDQMHDIIHTCGLKVFLRLARNP